MLYLISDHHFDHTNIIRFSNRPFENIRQMNMTMITRWNSIVGPDDVVFHLGDFAFSSGRRIALLRSRLNGKIVLIQGNHDNAKLMRRCGFIVPNERYIVYGGIFLSHEPLGEDIVKGNINIHGHIHHWLNKDRHHFNVAVEQTNYYPVTFEQAFNLPMRCDRCGGPAPRNNQYDLCNRCMEMELWIQQEIQS